jgi:hypothetical protein
MAIELQSALYAAAVPLMERSGVGGRVAQVCVDARLYSLPDATFGAAVSWLTIVYVPGRPYPLKRLARASRRRPLLHRAPRPAGILRQGICRSSKRHCSPARCPVFGSTWPICPPRASAGVPDNNRRERISAMLQLPATPDPLPTYVPNSDYSGLHRRRESGTPLETPKELRGDTNGRG